MTTLIYFSNDLRVHDNPLLTKAAALGEPLLCVYYLDERVFKPSRYNALLPMGKTRWLFIYETLVALDEQLQALGQQLYIVHDKVEQHLPALIDRYHINTVLSSRQFGWMENTVLTAAIHTATQHAWANKRELVHRVIDSYTLFDDQDLPQQGPFPKSFSQFRKQVESRYHAPDSVAIDRLPQPLMVSANGAHPRIDTLAFFRASFHGPMMVLDTQALSMNTATVKLSRPLFNGGEQQGQRHILRYFDGGFASSYKQTRNALEGWNHSCKFSPWLACGSVSVHYIMRQLAAYEQEQGANASTEWIYIELLWREYFQWYAQHYQQRLFSFGGISNRKPLSSFYPHRFRIWCHGQTPWPLVNACMKELNTTGYLSNRGRQIVASCLVNELEVDWRYGAAYFQQQLIDYDVAVNWGNWQYIAGVGADPRGGRHFNLAKQTAQFDPDGTYTKKWCGAGDDEINNNKQNSDNYGIDYVDAADWPIMVQPHAKQVILDVEAASQHSLQSSLTTVSDPDSSLYTHHSKGSNHAD